MNGREYGSKGRVGVAPPQANPTVEPEIAACLPPNVGMYVTRLTSTCATPKERFVEYFDNLDRSLQAYDTFKPDAFAFACTATSYLFGHEKEAKEVDALSKKFGYPIITGGQAIVAALKKIGAKKVAIGAPYPEFVIDACRAYYEAAGFTITALKRIVTRLADTRTIYELKSSDAITALEGFDLNGADTMLFTGSGMPGFRAIIEGEKITGLPVLTSNICMGWWLCKAIGQENWAKGPHKLLNGWQDRVESL